MTQGELEKIPQRIVNEMSRLEVRIMEDMVRRIRINGFSTASADWQFTRLQQLGMSEEQIKKWVQEVLETSDKEIEKIYSDDTYKEYMKHSRAFDIYGQEQLPFSENAELQSLIEAVKQQTREELENITSSMGFVKPTPSGGLQMMTQTEFYQRTLDDAMYDIHSGAFDYNTVLRRTIEDMTRSGIRWIDYESGHHNRIPVAARRAVMTGFRQVQGKINEQTARALGTDFYEVTVHIGARPSHQVWEGQVWSMEQLQSVCGLGTVTGLHGANCYHDYNAFIPGVSTRTYTDEQLEQIHEEENKPKTYNGKEYTTYEALQRQRQLETRARKYREDVHLLEEGGGSEDDIIAKKSRYQKTLQEYKAFSKKMGLPMQKERIYQDGLNVDIPERDLSKVAAAKPKAEIKRRAINKAGKEVVFDFKAVDDKRQKQIDILSELTMEYNTRLERVSHGAQNAAGDVQISGSLMRLSDKNVETAVHEFAHTLANTDADKYGLTQDQEFWKEIRKIRREYLKDVDATQDPSRIISFYEHSSRSVDEFFAEAFTHAKLREMGLPIPERFGGDYTYSQRVLDTVDKYFGKEGREAFLLRNNIPRSFADTRTIGDPISKDDLRAFIERANSKGIRIGADPGSTGNFELYCGDPKVLDDVVEHLGKSIDDAKKAGIMNANDDVILRYDNVLGYKGDNSAIDIGAFAETKGKTITLNKFMFDDTAHLLKEYTEAVQNGDFAHGTTYKNVIDHEFGHIIDKRSSIRKRLISILQKEAADVNMSLESYIITRISGYAASNKRGNPFCELVSELYSQLKGNESSFAAELFRKVGVL